MTDDNHDLNPESNSIVSTIFDTINRHTNFPVAEALVPFNPIQLPS